VYFTQYVHARRSFMSHSTEEVQAGIHEDVIPDLIARAITRISDRAVESFKNQNSLSVKVSVVLFKALTDF
jgi:hypothetical protein